MLGAVKPRRLDQPVAVSLEDLVPRDHFYRHLEARLHLNFVRDWTRELYAERGRPSIDPVVFFSYARATQPYPGTEAPREYRDRLEVHIARIRERFGFAEDISKAREITRAVPRSRTCAADRNPGQLALALPGL